jgi:hypothetical protein
VQHLSITGRDVHEQELAMQFQDGFWTVLGDAEEYRLSKESREVLAALSEAGKPLTPKQLATRLSIPVGTIRVRLKRMIERGEVLNHGDGYIPRTIPSLSPESGDKEDVTPVMDVTRVTGVTGVILVQEGPELQVGTGGV